MLPFMVKLFFDRLILDVFLALHKIVLHVPYMGPTS